MTEKQIRIDTEALAEAREKARAPFLEVLAELQRRCSTYNREDAKTLAEAREEAYATVVIMLRRAAAEDTP